MMRLPLFFLVLFSSVSAAAQKFCFEQEVKRLFFGVDVVSGSPDLPDSFRALPQLQYQEHPGKQWNLNTTLQVKGGNALATTHRFMFTASPLPGLHIQGGIIEVKIGESDSTRKLLDIHWILQFADRRSGVQYFKALTKLFGALATHKKLSHEAGIGDVAEFSCKGANGIREIAFVFGASPVSGRYEIMMSR